MKLKRFGVILFIYCNFCYFSGMMLGQLAGIVAGEDVKEGSAAYIFAGLLNRLGLTGGTNDDGWILQMLLALGCACLTAAVLAIIKVKKINLENLFFSVEGRCLAFVWICVLLFVSYNKFDSFYTDYGFEGVDLSFLNGMLLFGISAAAVAFLLKFPAIAELETYFKGKNGFLFAVVLLWIDFACSGQRLFLSSPDKVWTIDIVTLCVFIFFGMWLVPFVLMTLFFMERVKGKWRERDRENRVCPREGIFLFGLMAAIWIACGLICYPSVLTEDGIDAWTEVLSGEKFTVAFPPIIKSVWRMLYRIVPTVEIVTVLQAVLLGAVVAAWFYFFMQKGLSFRKALTLVLIFSLLPSTYLYVITHGSNLYYVVAILWTLLFLVKTVENVDYMKKGHWGAVFGWGFSLSMIYMCRREGFAVIFLICLCIVCVCALNKIWKPLLSIVVMGVLVAVLQNSIYGEGTVMGSSSLGAGGINGLLNDVTLAVLYFDGNMSEDDRSVLENFGTREEIAAYYTDFQYDVHVEKVLRKFMKDDALVQGVAIRSIRNNLDVAFRERLNKSESVWCVVNPKGAHLDRRSRTVVANNLGFVATENLLTVILKKILYFPTFMFCVSDMLLYRSGIYLCTMLVLGLFWVKNREGRKLWTLGPIFAHAAVMMLVLLWSCARHTWCIILMSVLLIINELVGNENAM